MIKWKIPYLAILFVFLLSGLSFAGEVKVEELVKSTNSWNGVSLPDEDGSETEVTVLRITVAPHTKLPMHFHPVINVAYILEGKLTVIAKSGERKTIGSGEPLIELVDQDHFGINETNEVVKLIVVYVGEKGQPVTIKN